MPRESERLWGERPTRWADQVQRYQRSVNTFHQAMLHWTTRRRTSSVPSSRPEPRLQSLPTPPGPARIDQKLMKQSANTLTGPPPAGPLEPCPESPNGIELLTGRQREIAAQIALGLFSRLSAGAAFLRRRQLDAGAPSL